MHPLNLYQMTEKSSILLRFAVGKYENTAEGNGWES
jgi:hypothetical protein